MPNLHLDPVSVQKRIDEQVAAATQDIVPFVANSAAATVGDVNTKFNELLTALKTAGLMPTS